MSPAETKREWLVPGGLRIFEQCACQLKPGGLRNFEQRACQLKPCSARRSGVALFDPLQEYIIRHHTRYTDRECWAWSPCGANDYAEQLPVDDGAGFLVQPQVCKRLSARKSPSQYLLVDGSATRDRDNVWVDCTSCYALGKYQARCPWHECL